MKVQALGLQNSVVTTYDQTKTTLQGRATQKTITDGNGPKICLGPSPVVFADVFDDTGVAPVTINASTPNGRVFIGKGVVTNVWTVSYYTLNTQTGATAWVGDLKFTFGAAAITYTIKGLTIDDSNPASMKFMWSATHTTATNGGLFACFGVNITDFVQVSVPTFPVATLANQTKTVYQLGDNAAQASQTLTVSDGCDFDLNTVYVLNGAAATPKIFAFNITAPPAAVPGANGYDSSLFLLATANLTALSGTVLLTNNVKTLTPGSWSTNSGFKCLSFLTTTTIYHAKLSDITSGATTLPSLVSGNMVTTGDYLTPTISFGQYSLALDKFVMLTSLGELLVKVGTNNDANGKLIGTGADYIKGEIGGTITPIGFNAVTPSCMTMCNGWCIQLSTAIGQRGFLAVDLYSDESSTTAGQINTSVISPVISGSFTKGVLMGFLYELSKRSVKATVQFRTSSFATGPGAGFDATWTSIPKDGDLSTIANATQVQFRLLFTLMGISTVNTPQIVEAYFAYTDVTQSSDNWVGSLDNTSTNGSNPFRVAFRLQTAYASTVPKLFIRGVDDSGNAVVFDTVANIGNMEFTTNNGTSWSALGTIPNTPLTTELRFNWTSPDGVRRRWSINES